MHITPVAGMCNVAHTGQILYVDDLDPVITVARLVITASYRPQPANIYLL